MDEPCSALDPIATAKVEALIDELKEEFTIVIVTHNMQQATRCSDMTAFFYLGNLIEFDRTEKIFSNPSQKQTEDYISGRFGYGSRIFRSRIFNHRLHRFHRFWGGDVWDVSRIYGGVRHALPVSAS